MPLQIPAKGAICLIVCLWLLTVSGSATERWASVNQCTDRMLAHLAPDKLVSVTWLSHEEAPPSLQPTINGLPTNHAQVEELLALGATHVLGGSYGAPGLERALAPFQIHFERLPYAPTVAQSLNNWTKLGQSLNRDKLARSIQQNISDTLANYRSQLRHKSPEVLLVTPNGWTVGEGVLAHDVLREMGVTNLAARKGIKGWSQLSLETLIRWQPAHLLIHYPQTEHYSQASAWLEHPVLIKAFQNDLRIIELRAAYLDCLGPESLTAIRQLGEALLAGRS